jgi:hypothetical protein
MVAEPLEFYNKYDLNDDVFGIANVKSDTCKLTVGYFLSDTKITILLPESCYYCQKSGICCKKFGNQIIQKLNQKDKGKVTYFLM